MAWSIDGRGSAWLGRRTGRGCDAKVKRGEPDCPLKTRNRRRSGSRYCCCCAGIGQQQRQKIGSVSTRPGRDHGRCCHVGRSSWTARAGHLLSRHSAFIVRIVLFPQQPHGHRTGTREAYIEAYEARATRITRTNKQGESKILSLGGVCPRTTEFNTPPCDERETRRDEEA